MKKYIYIGGIISILIGVIFYLISEIKEVKADRDVYKGNTIALLSEAKQYMTKDSLNVISVQALTLKQSEFEKYRSEDAKLIKTLQTKNRSLESVTTMQTQTISKLKGSVRDSLVYRDNFVVDTLYCVDIVDRWFDLHGCANKKREFTGTHISRDSLLLVATIKYKRFLGFLWKTSKVKDKRMDVVSRNPSTRIEGVEFKILRE